MNSRERVFKTLEFSNPDRAPRNLWSLAWVDFFVAEERDKLLKEFPGDFTNPGPFLAKGDRAQGVPSRKGTYIDDWGCQWECGEDGVIGEVKNHLFSDWSAVDNYQPPWEILEQTNWDVVNKAQKRNLAGPKKFMMCGTTLRPFERMQFLRGSENLYIDLGYATKQVRNLRDMLHEFYMKELAYCIKTDCDGLTFMDDWGSQTSLLISPKLWREFFKPLYKDYCEMIHKAGKKVFFHSDGHIMDIYEDLIEIGIDAVNSQLFCMDIEQIAVRFKGRITFWGEIDRQNILPFGTVEDVYKAVERVRCALDDGTGGVIAQCEWGSHVPADNIRAVFNTWDMPLECLKDEVVKGIK